MKSVRVFLVSFLSLTEALFHASTSQRQDNAGLSPVEIAEKYGYPVETHDIQTADGYILTVQRIPHGRNRTSASNPPILLQHGLGCSSDIFVLLGPQKSLGFLLADAGYDVWLGNARGNRHSLKHVFYTRDDPEFWDYSWHEMGAFDLPAVVDYILNETKMEKMYYLGHSMGMNMIMILLSTYPEYNSKIKLVLGLAPAVYVGETRSALFTFFTRDYAPIILKGGPKEWIPYIDSLTSTIWPLCEPKLSTAILCYSAYASLNGPSTDVAMSSLPAILSIFPTSSSAKTFAHFGQSVISGKFQNYNYGTEKNRLIYGADEPPDYNIHLATAPAALFYSDGDTIAHPKDVLKLNKTHPNVVFLYRVPQSAFNHLDFAFGKSAINHLYKEILKTLVNF